ncbi:type 2 periplasmic-binding domain-containing protein [Vibrio ulleungensis]|uniref:ABC transporter substrate-binding protein n=1 Tax=Vibrio ulleungensis TaxID=2807619 RepID=A0ABS2HEN3_9VIBR|nr:ABC transporter substrate-binding protein [Vibrio ulleungensis]MBM7035514.1 ABC transporter substrate-binding protein [Vibrio ulleungensis]
MIQFWNGNKTAARQAHEYELVSELLSSREIHNDLTDYPNAEDESNIFHNGADLLVTVAGNPKFAPGTFIEVAPPLCFGLLGCRLLITRKIDVQFDYMTQLELKQKIAGVPATWADATLLRDNGCTVLEEGDIEHILTSISQGNADYLSLGANEVHAVFDQFKSRFPDLHIHPETMIYYPLPLVFYVSPEQPELAERLSKCMRRMYRSGDLLGLLKAHYGESIQASYIDKKHCVKLDNPALTEEQNQWPCIFLS